MAHLGVNDVSSSVDDWQGIAVLQTPWLPFASAAAARGLLPPVSAGASASVITHVSLAAGGDGNTLHLDQPGLSVPRGDGTAIQASRRCLR